MNNDELQRVPFVVYEAGMSRLERTNKRLLIVVVLSVVLMFVSNAIWLYAWMQYDYSSETTETTQDYWQDGNGYNNINTGTQGDVNNGTEIPSNNDATTESTP